MEFTSKDNICGFNLVCLTARGSVIIAELLQIASSIPDPFQKDESNTAYEQSSFDEILFDFQYLKDPDVFEKKITDNLMLIEVDMELYETYAELIRRFYLLFESIWMFQLDISKFIEDVNNGYYIHHSINSILDDVEGKQLFCELIYSYGMMLIFLEENLPGYIRERILIFEYRHNTDDSLLSMEDICKLCRSTGYNSKSKKALKSRNNLELLFSRFCPNTDVIRLLLNRLQSDDIYLMSQSYPNPEHRSIRLGTQAAMLVVILYFVPDILHSENIMMREIVDKYFYDNWVVPLYMGYTIDLTTEWSKYPAAKLAIDNVINLNSIILLNEKNKIQISSNLKELKYYLQEGILQEDLILDQLTLFINLIRDSNNALRWRLLHRRCVEERYKTIILGNTATATALSPLSSSSPSLSNSDIITFLLSLSQIENILKNLLQNLLKQKMMLWDGYKSDIQQQLIELSSYFDGTKTSLKIPRNDNMMSWFQNLAVQVQNLEVQDDTASATSTGRIIKSMMKALKDIEQYEVFEFQITLQTYIKNSLQQLHNLIRLSNIQNNIIDQIETISDFSYAWLCLNDYIPEFHNQIKNNPHDVILLRTTFLKTASILDFPLVRLNLINSDDLNYVAEFYSKKLIQFVRNVLEVIPMSVFQLLNEIVYIQTHRLIPIPSKLERKFLKEHAQIDLRQQLSKLTHQISLFTEGILLMKRTLLGVIEVDPKDILEQGIRKELVRLLTNALHHQLIFSNLDNNNNNNSSSSSSSNNNYMIAIKDEFHYKLSLLSAALDGFKRSMEYIQDYLAMNGLKIYQQELLRIISYHEEQETNRFIVKKIYDSNSKYQNDTAPIPKMNLESQITEGGYVQMNFMGRILSNLLSLTDATRTVYSLGHITWYLYSEKKPPSRPNSISSVSSSLSPSNEWMRDSCNRSTFYLIEQAVGPAGVHGLDRLLSFRTAHLIRNFLKSYSSDISPFRLTLETMRDRLQPVECIVSEENGSLTIYSTVINKIQIIFTPFLKLIRRVGQSQLLRLEFTHVLKKGSQQRAQLLSKSVDTLNQSLLNDMMALQSKSSSSPRDEDDKPSESENNDRGIDHITRVFVKLNPLIDSCGYDDPVHKVYVTTHALEFIPEILFLFVLFWIPNMEWDADYGTLVRKKAKHPVDGIPLIAGIGCFLRQFHQDTSEVFLSYLRQFIRTHIHSVLKSSIDSNAKSFISAIPKDIYHLMIFIEKFCLFMSLPLVPHHELLPAVLMS